MRKIPVVLFLCVLLFAHAAPSAAAGGPLDEVVRAFERNDYAAAYRLVLPLAEKGHPRAQNLLGYMYHSGQGAKRDYGQAVKWYRMAAEQGDAEAQNNVGVMYEQGLGVWQDESEAVKWYARSAEQGNPMAQNNLGIMYAFGRGVEQDFPTAYIWFSLAASRFPASQQERREQAVGNRDTAAYNMTIEEVAEAQKQVRAWKPTKERIRT